MAFSIQRALEELRAKTLAQGAAPIEPNRKDGAQAGVVDEDAQALSEMLQVLNSQRNKTQAELIARIERALRKCKESPEMIGLCEECEEKIPIKRLKLMPYAAFCAGCQTRRDPQRGGARKKLTDFL